MALKIARVFPRKTKATPDDDLAFFGPPDLFAPEVDEVHISVTFTYDRLKAEQLAEQWRHIAPVKIGGVGWRSPEFPAGDPGADFVPGRYIKPGYTFTSRGCPRGRQRRAVRRVYVGDVFLTQHGGCDMRTGSVNYDHNATRSRRPGCARSTARQDPHPSETVPGSGRRQGRHQPPNLERLGAWPQVPEHEPSAPHRPARPGQTRRLTARRLFPRFFRIPLDCQLSQRINTCVVKVDIRETAMDTFTTPTAWKLYQKSFDGRGDPSDLETFYSPDQTERILCTTDEREDFEESAEIALTADVIEDRSDYDALVRYLAENCKLRRKE